MIRDFEYEVRTHYVFGRDAQKKIGQMLYQRGATTVMIVHDSGSFLYDSGLLEEIKDNLSNAGLAIVEFGGVRPNPTVEHVRNGIVLAKDSKTDYLLAIGGGSSIDSAKAIAAGVHYEGDVWDFYDLGIQASEALPLAVVLTYPATGSECGTTSALFSEKQVAKRAYTSEILRPTIAFMNPELSFTLPKNLTACGITDMYVHAMERYFSPVDGYGIMDRFNESIFQTLLEMAPRVLRNPRDYDARAEIMWIGAVAHGNNTTGLGRPIDWGSHMLGDQISTYYNTPHGITLSVIVPAWMRYVYQTDVDRFARYAKVVFGIDPTGKTAEQMALNGIEETKKFFHSMGMPTSFTEANIPTDQFRLMAESLMDRTHGPAGQFFKMTVDDMIHIYQDSI